MVYNYLGTEGADPEVDIVIQFILTFNLVSLH